MSKIIKKKAIILEHDDLKFHIRPQSFTDLTGVAKWMEEQGVSSESKHAVLTFTTDAVGFLMRIEKWEGVLLENGKKAPCSMENKLDFFGQNTDDLLALVNLYGKTVVEDSKN